MDDKTCRERVSVINNQIDEIHFPSDYGCVWPRSKMQLEVGANSKIPNNSTSENKKCKVCNHGSLILWNDKGAGANFQQIGLKKVEPLWELSFRLHLQTHPKMNHDILDLLDKSKTPGCCGFHLANLHKGKSLHFVPFSQILTINFKRDKSSAM